MITGWQNVGSTWYYLSDDGEMYQGWLQEGNSWYYLVPNSGEMKTNWQKLGSTYYYFNSSGIMQTGWISYGGSRYYLELDGTMHIGWLLYNNAWYYFDPIIGNSKTGWLQTGNQWYFLNNAGIMITGFLDYGNNRYYLSTNGTMIVGTHTINSVRYVFSGNGALTGWYEGSSFQQFLGIIKEFSFYRYNGFVIDKNVPIYASIPGYTPNPQIAMYGNSLANKTLTINRELLTSRGRFASFTYNNRTYWVDKSKVSRNDLPQRFISQITPAVEKAIQGYDQFASIMAAQAILESGYGQSELAAKHNNFFGIKAPANYDGESVMMPTKEYDNNLGWYEIIAAFKKYPTMEDSFKDRAEFMKNGGNTGNPNFYKPASKSIAQNYQNATKYLTGTYATAADYDVQLNKLIEYWELDNLD